MSNPDLVRQNELLQAQVGALQQQVAQMQMLLHQRAEPVAVATLDTLGNWVAMAQQGHPQAQELLARWVRMQDAARELVAARPALIPVVRANGLS